MIFAAWRRSVNMSSRLAVMRLTSRSLAMSSSKTMLRLISGQGTVDCFGLRQWLCDQTSGMWSCRYLAQLVIHMGGSFVIGYLHRPETESEVQVILFTTADANHSASWPLIRKSL